MFLKINHLFLSAYFLASWNFFPRKNFFSNNPKKKRKGEATSYRCEGEMCNVYETQEHHVFIFAVDLLFLLLFAFFGCTHTKHNNFSQNYVYPSMVRLPWHKLFWVSFINDVTWGCNKDQEFFWFSMTIISEMHPQCFFVIFCVCECANISNLPIHMCSLCSAGDISDLFVRFFQLPFSLRLSYSSIRFFFAF